jgi:hypothetical protein
MAKVIFLRDLSRNCTKLIMIFFPQPKENYISLTASEVTLALCKNSLKEKLISGKERMCL